MARPRPDPPSTEAPRLAGLVDEARCRLAAAPFEVSRREALLLAARVLGRSEAWVLAHTDEPVAPADARRFRALLERRAAGEPMAYLFGEREFYGRTFVVDPRVLIPRPETEHLVEAVLELDLGPRPRILDVGTGSGAIAVTLALELPGAEVTATDLAPAALSLARANARRLAAGALRFVASDLLAAVDPARFDLVVSNPPYVAEGDAPRLSPEVREHEPGLALFADGDGLAVIGELFRQAGGLASGARLALEIGDGQLEAVGERAAASGLELVRWQADYAGKPRVVMLRRSGAR